MICWDLRAAPGRRESTSSFHPRRSSETGTIPTAATIFARRRRPPLWSTRSTPSRWEVPREIYIGERQDPFRKVPSMVCEEISGGYCATRRRPRPIAATSVTRSITSGAVDREASPSGVLSHGGRTHRPMRPLAGEDRTLKFMLVNRTNAPWRHLQRVRPAAGLELVRHVSTQRQYCEYDCYRRYQRDSR